MFLWLHIQFQIQPSSNALHIKSCFVGHCNMRKWFHHDKKCSRFVTTSSIQFLWKRTKPFCWTKCYLNVSRDWCWSERKREMECVKWEGNRIYIVRYFNDGVSSFILIIPRQAPLSAAPQSIQIRYQNNLKISLYPLIYSPSHPQWRALYSEHSHIRCSTLECHHLNVYKILERFDSKI